MTPVLALALILAAPATTVPADGQSGASAGLPTPTDVPPYVAPLSVLDGELHLPAGEAPEVLPSKVCYGPAAHLRLTLALQLAPALSDERARLAWLTGWQAAGAEGAAALDAERQARLEADARAASSVARLQATQDATGSWWRDISTAAGLVGLGALIGFTVGVSR